MQPEYFDLAPAQCLFVYVPNKRQNGWTDWAQLLVATHTIPGIDYG